MWCKFQALFYLIFIRMKCFACEKWTWVEVQASGSFSFRNNKHVGFLDKSNRLHPLRVFNLKQPGTKLEILYGRHVIKTCFLVISVSVKAYLEDTSHYLKKRCNPSLTTQLTARSYWQIYFNPVYVITISNTKGKDMKWRAGDLLHH